MKYFVILLTLLSSSAGAQAQSSEDSVKAIVNRLFTAMNKADTAMLRSCFANEMILETVSDDKQGRTFINRESPEVFIEFLSEQKPGSADERIIF